MKQERPSVLADGSHLFYGGFSRVVTQDLQGLSKCEKLTVLWDLLQCKALAYPAPDDMVLESYKDHATQLQKVCHTDPHLLKDFRQFIQPWVNCLPSHLSSKTRLPNSHATFDTKHSTGGTFVDQMSKLTNQPLIQPDCPRMEPFTIALSGPAGSGKSRLQNLLALRLSRFLEREWEDTVYSRSSVMKHWDGYTQQPLTVIDDFGQKTVRSAQEHNEAMEFITMCSSVDYRLPMANLKEKGTKFTSPLLLLSTNLPRDHMNDYLSLVLMDKNAIDRRFDRFFRVSRCPKGQPVLIEQTLTLATSDFPGSSLTNERQLTGQRNVSQRCVATGWTDINNLLFKVMIEGWREKSRNYRDFGHHDTFQQHVGGDWYLEYPLEPIHHNQVKAHAILEPLKVRMITVGPGENWALKPLQKAMFNALSHFKCFRPCFTPDYDEEIKEMKGIPGKWLSGDYSAATDGLHSSMMSVAIQEVVNVLETYYPELIPYVLLESSPHRILYPSWTGIDPIDQTNGQLMGSLLSFPILSLVNAFTISKATQKRMADIPALIHGDDVLARLTSDEINRWKTVAPRVGLELSIGKNYVSNSWGSIDSQVFYRGSRIESCGKWKGLDGDDIESIPLLIKRGFPNWLIVSRHKQALQKTHRSLEVSVEYGGLNPNPGLLPQTPTDHAQYVASLSRQVKIRKVLGKTFARVPMNFIVPTMRIEKLPFELPREAPGYSFSDFRQVLKLRELGTTVPHTEFLPLQPPAMNIELRDDHSVTFLRNRWKSLCPVLTGADKEYLRVLEEIRHQESDCEDSQEAFDLL